jgi:hypothetical protein
VTFSGVILTYKRGNVDQESYREVAPPTISRVVRAIAAVPCVVAADVEFRDCESLACHHHSGAHATWRRATIERREVVSVVRW